MTLEDIDLIVVLVQTKDGNAHQVLASKEEKRAALLMLCDENGLRLSEEIEPISFTPKN